MPVPGAQQPYVGRFAPSPTGPLHAGSLVAAMGSYLDCLQHQGRWLLRMEDLDPPREVPGAANAILRSLELHGFEWSGPVVYQSTRLNRYQHALSVLQATGQLYACRCSRKDLANTGALAARSRAYPGTCRNAGLSSRGGRALRFKVPPGEVFFEDRLQGKWYEDVAATCGDFIVLRRDSLVAYQLAVVVDDAEQGINNVVRGSDLLDSTARQIRLQQALGYRQPAYLHLPLLLGTGGHKLSKQNGAAALDDGRVVANLAAAFNLLNSDQTASQDWSTAGEFWSWARENWDPKTLRGRLDFAAQGVSGP